LSDSIYMESLSFLRGIMKRYSGYEIQSKRDNSDKIVRQYLADLLTECLDKTREAQEAAIFTQMTVIWPDIEALVARLEKILSIVEKTDYEMSTFFTSSRLEGFDPKVLILAEAEIMKLLRNLRETFSDFYDSIESGLLDVSSENMTQILRNVSRIEALYTERIILIREYRKF